MDEVTRGLLIGGAVSLLSVIFPAIINKIKPRSEADKLRSESDQIDAGTIKALSLQVNELINDKVEMNKRIDHLEGELRRYTNGFARAVRFIRENNPNVEIPNFLDTNPKIGAK